MFDPILGADDICIDAETYWSKDYTLSGMTTREYIMDDRFEVQLLAVKTMTERFTLELPDIWDWVQSIDWGSKRMIGHNLQFDGAIMAWRYGVLPREYFCTAQSSRAVLSHLIGSASLKKVAGHYGMFKDSQALFNTKGLRFYQMDRDGGDYKRFLRYAGDDAHQSWQIARRHIKLLPEQMLRLIDAMTRMYVQGRLELDVPLLEQNLQEEHQRTEQLLQAAGIVDKKEITSRDKFADRLSLHGVNPPRKISERTGNETWAFSKKDMEFMELLEHDNPVVRNLVECRLNAASSLEETRTKTFLNLAKQPGKKLHVPLFVSGAHTHRFSGTDNLNLQNLPRASLLRKAIKAPEGYKVVAVDASQIEARILAYVAGCKPLVKAFAGGEDVYSTFASVVYKQPVTKQDNPAERFVGKTGILGLGYGTGKDKFKTTLNLSNVECDEDFAQQIVTTYRTTYPEIPMFWKQCNAAISTMHLGGSSAIGGMTTHKDYLESPYGLEMHYPKLRPMVETLIGDDGEEYQSNGYEYYRHRYNMFTKIYGAKLCENIIQHLAWTIIAETIIDIADIYPEWFCAMQVHDEVVYVVPDDEADYALSTIIRYMCRQPDWAWKSYEIPLAAEGAIGDNYLECK